MGEPTKKDRALDCAVAEALGYTNFHERGEQPELCATPPGMAPGSWRVVWPYSSSIRRAWGCVHHLSLRGWRLASVGEYPAFGGVGGGWQAVFMERSSRRYFSFEASTPTEAICRAFLAVVDACPELREVPNVVD